MIVESLKALNIPRHPIDCQSCTRLCSSNWVRTSQIDPSLGELRSKSQKFIQDSSRIQSNSLVFWILIINFMFLQLNKVNYKIRSWSQSSEDWPQCLKIQIKVSKVHFHISTHNPQKSMSSARLETTLAYRESDLKSHEFISIPLQSNKNFENYFNSVLNHPY